MYVLKVNCLDEVHLSLPSKKGINYILKQSLLLNSKFKVLYSKFLSF